MATEAESSDEETEDGFQELFTMVWNLTIKQMLSAFINPQWMEAEIKRPSLQFLKLLNWL